GMGIIWLMNTLLDALLKPGIRMNHDDFVRAGFGLVALVLGAAVAYLIMKVRWRKTFFAVVFLVLSSTLSFAQVRLAPGTQLPPPGVVRPPSLNSPWREVTGPPERLPETPRIDVHQNQFLLPAAPTTFMCQEVAGKTTCQLRPIKEPLGTEPNLNRSARSQCGLLIGIRSLLNPATHD